MAYCSTVVRTPVHTVECQPRVDLVPPQDDCAGSEHPVAQVPNRTVQIALVRAEDRHDRLEAHENKDSDSEFCMERVWEGSEVMDGDREGWDHTADSRDLDRWRARVVRGE